MCLKCNRRNYHYTKCENSKEKVYNSTVYRSVVCSLQTYNPNPSSSELAYDIHFWIGSQSTQVGTLTFYMPATAAAAAVTTTTTTTTIIIIARKGGN